MTAFVTSNDKPPDLGALLPIAACLRTLVLDLPGVPVNITEVRRCILRCCRSNPRRKRFAQDAAWQGRTVSAAATHMQRQQTVVLLRARARGYQACRGAF